MSGPDPRAPISEAIAIVGVSGRFPGAPTLDVFWDNVCRGVESVTFFTDDEIRRHGNDPAALRDMGFVAAKPRIAGEDLFDARFFGYSAEEAEIIDPQQRLFLECAWEALEDAGYMPDRFPGLIGLFAGSNQNTYLWFNLLARPGFLHRQGIVRVVTTNGADYLATRASYKLNLTGPCISVQTACSTSLVAVHLACQSLNNFECDLALAGAVALNVSPYLGYIYEPGSMLSPDGHCRPFDAKAGGTLFGDGLGAVVLKRLDEAISDGDTIHAVIRGSAVNNDGAAKAGFTAVGLHGQAAVVFQALDNAGVSADTISYVETHGTGTPIGDAVEVKALTTAFRHSTALSGYCAIGSVKGNIGHLTAAAGMAGLLKTVLALKHEAIPPSGNFDTPHLELGLAGTPFVVSSGRREWRRGGAPRRAGVSAFGIGGTNAHLIVEEAPPATSGGPSPRARHLVVLSARTASALAAVRDRLLHVLRREAGINLADVAFTLQVGRRAFEHRTAVAGSSVGEIIAALESGQGLDREPEGELATIGRRWVAGGDVDWSALWGKERRRRLPLPTYPFERQRYWSEVATVDSSPLPVPPASNEPRDVPAAATRGRPALSVPFREPATETERRVAGIWRDLLRLDEAGADDQFFELGGDSLAATQLINRIRSAFGRELTVRDVVTHGTIAALASRIDEGGEVRQAAGIEREVSSSAPLSFAQERLWFLDRLEPGSAAYHLPLALRVESRIGADWVRRALAYLIERHEILRTTFTEREGRPEQVIAGAGEPELDVVDLDGLPDHRREAEISRLAIDAFQRPFDLSSGPLLRTTLILTPATSVLLFTIHHIVSDGWSMDLFAREFAHAYLAIASGRKPGLAALPVQYADFARWQHKVFRGDERSRQLDYWTHELAALPVLDLPTDFPRPPVQTFHGAVRTLPIDPQLSAAVRQLARESGLSVFATTLAAFATVLHRYANQDDVAIGSPVANRSRQETEGLIGLFVNTLVVRARFEDNPTVRELVARVADTVLRAQEHQDLPFEQLVDALQPPRDLSRNPVFQVMFAHVKSAAEGAPPGAIQALDLTPAVSKFDLTLTVYERGDELRAALEYNVDLFRADTAERLGGYFQRVLRAMVEDGEARVADLPMLDRIERETLLDAWNRTVEAPAPWPTLGAALTATAAREGDRDAIICGAERLSYRELDRRAARLSARLTALGVGGDRLVGVCLPRSIELIVALAAVAKAGGAYVPLDPALPAERLALMADDAELAVLVTQRHVAAAAALRAGQRLYLEDAILAEGAPAEPADPATAVSPDHLAYVLFTSGSTGRPKGVQISQGALMNLLAAMRRRPGLSAGDRLLAVTTLSFDIAALELWLPLTTGATVVLASSEEAADGRALMRLLDTSGATVMQATPATWRLLHDAGWTNPAGVRILVGGEALPPDVASYLRAGARPGARPPVWNLYGPTETTIWSLVHDVEEVQGAVPIGRPIANTRVYVLDDRLEPVPVNTPGELYIGGAGLARGYVNQPSLTAARFLPDPHAAVPGARMYATGDLARVRHTGTIEFLGRADGQVKLHGHRIELGEIEQTLAQHPGVRQVVAARREDRPGVPQLFAYVVPTAIGAGFRAGELRERAARTLPDYMVPSHYIVIDQVPLTPNGKIDRARLPAPERNLASARARIEPRTEAERQMAVLWSDVLAAPVGSIDDDFFEIGGHSMLAAKLLAAVRRAFGVDLPLRSLFEAPTVATLTSVVSSVARGGSNESTLREAESGLRADAVLAADVIPDGSAPDLSLPPRAIFLTGATGFLGAFLLHELLEQTTADIACLVRASSAEDGVRRLKSAMAKYGRWRDEYASRVRIVPGDLGDPRFGLSYADFERLADQVDVIYHNGALVNFVYPYRRLKAANVGGTEEVLRLACRVRTKPVHYVSTMDVLGAAYFTSGEEDDAAGTSGWTTGYAQSKWVAEQLVCEARARGVPAALYRPARVVGDSRSGIWNTDDFACRVIKGLVQLGWAPTIQPVDNMSPVDHVARAIVRLSIAPSATGRRAFHVVNPQWFVWSRMFEFIRRRGYPLAEEPYPAWWARLAQACAAGDDNALKPLLPLFPAPPDPLPPGADLPQPDPELPPVYCANTLAGLAGSGVACPVIDEGLLDRYFDHFVRGGFLEPAPAARVHA